MHIFVSHITPEAPLAIAIKDWIESTFLGQCDVFVSNDGTSIPPGSRWLDELCYSLDKTKAMVILCSPNSISQPWINFEAGCAWIRKIPVIPVCHSGLLPEELPPPLSSLQALHLGSGNFPEQFIQAIANYFGIKRLPRISYSEMHKELLSNETECAITAEREGQHSSHAYAVLEIDDQKLAILKYLAQTEEWGHDGTDDRHIMSSTNIQLTKLRYHLEYLESKEYIYVAYSTVDPPYYSLAPKGRAYLIENDFM